MNAYTIPIGTALIFFPLVAVLITTPFMIYYYHRYGSISWFRAILFYSFVLFCMCAYFLVILPLPSIASVAASDGVQPNFRPFRMIWELKSATHIVLRDPSTYLPALESSFVLQYLFNVLLLLPYGFYLRYFFRCSFPKALLITFCTTLFFEITQISGLYGVYPKAYRCFDVDDLICNTLGGVLGYILTGPLLHVLPDREKADERARQRGSASVSVFRRLLAYGIDGILLQIFVALLYHFIPQIQEIYGVPIWIFFAYFLLCTQLFGRTPGKALLRCRVTVNRANKKWLPFRILLRYLILYAPLYVLSAGIHAIDPNQLHTVLTNYNLLFLVGGSGLLTGFVLFIEMIMNRLVKGHDYFWGGLTGTCVVSTILKEKETKTPSF